MDNRHSITSLGGNEAGTASSDVSRNPFVYDAIDFDKRVEEAMQHWRVPGLAFAVIDHHTITSHGYGVASLNGPMVTPRTVFDIASMSKSFTAAAMALLVQDSKSEQSKESGKDKKVDWTTPVNDLMPEFVFSDETMTREVSVEDILSHRTGLPGHDYSVYGVRSAHPDTPADVMRNMRNLPSSHPIRTTYQYNNLQYTCAAHMVETLSGTPFEEILRKKFWEPLGMNRTWLGVESVPEEEKDNTAQGYLWVKESGEVVALSHNPEPENIGNGAIQASVEDVARWIHAQIYRLPPLTKESYEELTTPRILQDQPREGLKGMTPSFYALGWEVSWYHGYQIVKHDGSWSGFISNMLYIPEKEWGLVMLSNSEDADYVESEIEFHLIDELLGIEKQKRYDWRGYADKQIQENKPKTKEELFPELPSHLDDGTKEEPDLRQLTGKYENIGYHVLTLMYNEDKKQIEADCSDRSFAFLLRLKERAYGYCYVCEIVDPDAKDAWVIRCEFKVDEMGKGKRFGVAFNPEVGDLTWFDRVEE